jgi:anti-sigma factor ChrR (cupin superfamily)
MKVNSDFTRRAAVHAASVDWIPSPMPGVERRMLDRIGAESGHATTIVRYAAESQYSAHTHVGGEEFLVLDGVFQDEHGDFHAGMYVRNPPGSRHAPGSAPGCTIFVKLWQFDSNDTTSLRIDTHKVPFLPVPGREGVEKLALFKDAREDVRLERWAPGASIALDGPEGIELLVLEGGFSDSGGHFVSLSWLRLPMGSTLQATADAAGCKVWIKTGHLAHIGGTSPVAA